MVNDTISDVLTRIRNANRVKKQTVILPHTKTTQRLCEILSREGFIDSFEKKGEIELDITLKYLGREKRPCITNLKRVSKPGLRNYTTHKEIPKILGGMGIVILSTSHGIMTGREARFQKIGGEILCAIW